MADKQGSMTGQHTQVSDDKSLHVPPQDENKLDQHATMNASKVKLINKVKPYDLAVKHNIIPERLMALEIINERFARNFRIGLFNLLRRDTDVSTTPIESYTFYELSRNLSATQLNLVYLNPLRGTSLFSFAPELIFIVVDTLFGGDGRFSITETNRREFTHTEHEIIKRVLQLALSIYQTAWSDIYAIETEYIRSEVQSKFTNITSSPNDIVLISRFMVEIGQYKTQLCICIPYTMIEPIKDILITPPMEEQSNQDDQIWMKSLTSGIKQSMVELVANFSEIHTSVAKLLALKKNDILMIEKPTFLDVTVGGVPVLKGHYGKVNKQYAIQVEQIINPVLEQLNEEIIND